MSRGTEAWVSWQTSVAVRVPKSIDLNPNPNPNLNIVNDWIDRWLRPPNFLLVDYYNVGAGSVFEVAAQHNNVKYNRECCGMVPSSAITWKHDWHLFVAAVGVASFLVLV